MKLFTSKRGSVLYSEDRSSFIEAFNRVQEAVNSNAVEHGFYDEPRSIGDAIALIHSELSEALEEYRNGRDTDEVYFPESDKPEGFGVELADAIIRIMDTAEDNGIDLAAIILQKHDYNVTRPFRHGGKVI